MPGVPQTESNGHNGNAAAAIRIPEAPLALEPEQLQLFADLGVDLRALGIECAELARNGHSRNTHKAYDNCWKHFESWCAQAARWPLPATISTVALYVVDLARQGRLMSTIEQRVAAIGSKHLTSGYTGPTRRDLRAILGALKRKHGSAPRHAKAALEVPELKLMTAACPETPKGIRDRAILLFGFASGLRGSELVGLDLADLDIGPAGITIRLRRSKTDQQGDGREFGVNRGAHPETCPVRAVEAWVVERGRWPGALFCAFKPGGAVVHRRLCAKWIWATVKRAAKGAGLDASRYGAHSLRAGLATVASANGAPELAIMARTGHKGLAMLGRYIRHANLFKVDPLRGVL